VNQLIITISKIKPILREAAYNALRKRSLGLNEQSLPAWALLGAFSYRNGIKPLTSEFVLNWLGIS
jgi:hypothetical protein